MKWKIKIIQSSFAVTYERQTFTKLTSLKPEEPTETGGLETNKTLHTPHVLGPSEFSSSAIDLT